MTSLQHTPPDAPSPGPVADEADSRPKWPMVLGVMSLIYAILGLTCQMFYGALLAFGTSIPEALRGGMEFPPIVRLTGGIQIGLTLIAGLLLLFGAVAMLRRRRKAVSLLKTWVVVRLLLAFAGLLSAYVLMPANIQMQRSSERYLERLAAEHPGRAPAHTPQTDQQIARQSMIQSTIMTALAAAYPLFLGFWMTRRRVVDEVARWE